MTVHLMSPVKKINELWIYEFPAGKPINVKKACRVAGVTLLINDKGRVYTTRGKSASYMLGRGDLTDAMIKALQRLGAITKAQLEEHMAAATKRSEDRRKKYAADELLSASKILGVPLTKTQRTAAINAGGTTE